MNVSLNEVKDYLDERVVEEMIMNYNFLEISFLIYLPEVKVDFFVYDYHTLTVEMPNV